MGAQFGSRRPLAHPPPLPRALRDVYRRPLQSSGGHVLPKCSQGVCKLNCALAVTPASPCNGTKAGCSLASGIRWGLTERQSGKAPDMEKIAPSRVAPGSEKSVREVGRCFELLSAQRGLSIESPTEKKGFKSAPRPPPAGACRRRASGAQREQTRRQTEVCKRENRRVCSLKTSVS